VKPDRAVVPISSHRSSFSASSGIRMALIDI